MILKKIDNVEAIKLSEIFNRYVNNQYPDFRPSEYEKSSILKSSNSPQKVVWELFYEVVNGTETRYIFEQTNIDDVYKINDLHTKKILDKIFYAMNYLEAMKEGGYSIFSSIYTPDEKYNLMIENGYDIHNNDDLNKLLEYFYNYELHFRTKR